MTKIQLCGGTIGAHNPQQAMADYYANQMVKKDYMIAGQAMTRDEFLQAVFPEDTAQRTAFLLKYTKEK